MWKPMATAPKDRPILARRHNDVFYEYVIVWWEDSDLVYPWMNDYTSYPLDRLDEWHELPD